MTDKAGVSARFAAYRATEAAETAAYSERASRSDLDGLDGAEEAVLAAAREVPRDARGGGAGHDLGGAALAQRRVSRSDAIATALLGGIALVCWRGTKGHARRSRGRGSRGPRRCSAKERARGWRRCRRRRRSAGARGARADAAARGRLDAAEAELRTHRV
ncbi:hypothetical protein BE20_03555 [Sorangium cellulosum]|nr:hypothetical protein BE20_03555 [Sorangium cellulosum]